MTQEIPTTAQGSAVFKRELRAHGLDPAEVGPLLILAAEKMLQNDPPRVVSISSETIGQLERRILGHAR